MQFRSLGRESPGGGHSNPLQYTCLENPKDRGAWQATLHRITKSWTQLKQLSTHKSILMAKSIIDKTGPKYSYLSIL